MPHLLLGSKYWRSFIQYMEYGISMDDEEWIYPVWWIETASGLQEQNHKELSDKINKSLKTAGQDDLPTKCRSLWYYARPGTLLQRNTTSSKSAVSLWLYILRKTSSVDDDRCYIIAVRSRWARGSRPSRKLVWKLTFWLQPMSSLSRNIHPLFGLYLGKRIAAIRSKFSRLLSGGCAHCTLAAYRSSLVQCHGRYSQERLHSVFTTKAD